MKHSIFGDLCSTDVEVISQNSPAKMKIPGIPDENVIKAKPAEIFEY